MVKTAVQIIFICLFCMCALTGQADECRAMKNSGEITGRLSSTENSVTHSFGSIRYAGSRKNIAEANVPGRGRIKAWTAGEFLLNYTLVYDETLKKIKPEVLKIHLKQKDFYNAAPSPLLREHEEVHQRLNRWAAQNMERELADFKMDSSGKSSDLPRAEKDLLREFQKGLDHLKELHTAWDATHTIP